MSWFGRALVRELNYMYTNLFSVYTPETAIKTAQLNVDSADIKK